MVIPCAPVVLRLVELETSPSLPRLSDCANREWFPLSIAPMPGPVNQVHKPKPLGEVLLLNSSQLLEFSFPLSLLIGESWAFPGVYLQEKEKKEQKIIAQEESSFEEMFCDFTVYPPLPSSLLTLNVLPSQNLFVPLTTMLWEVPRWNAAYVWLWLRGATTPPLMFRL